MTMPTEAVVVVVRVRSDRRTEARTDPRRNPTRRIPTSIDMHTNLLSDRAGVRRTINLYITTQQKEETPNTVINHTSYLRTKQNLTRHE